MLLLHKLSELFFTVVLRDHYPGFYSWKIIPSVQNPSPYHFFVRATTPKFWCICREGFIHCWRFSVRENCRAKFLSLSLWCAPPTGKSCEFSISFSLYTQNSLGSLRPPAKEKLAGWDDSCILLLGGKSLGVRKSINLMGIRLYLRNASKKVNK